jgi:hypothetical protein
MDAEQRVGAVQLSTRLRGVSPPVTRRLRVAEQTSLAELHAALQVAFGWRAFMKMAAIYTRVSSEQQREERAISSQTAALIEFAKTRELDVPKEWVFEDEGYSGAALERPGLERVRDLAAEGQIQAILLPSMRRTRRLRMNLPNVAPKTPSMIHR